MVKPRCPHPYRDSAALFKTNKTDSYFAQAPPKEWDFPSYLNSCDDDETQEENVAEILNKYKAELRGLKILDEDGKVNRNLQIYVGELFKYSNIPEKQESVMTNTINGNNNLVVQHCSNVSLTVPAKRPSPTEAPTAHKRQAQEVNDEDDKMWTNLLRYNVVPCGYEAIEDPRVDKELYKNLKMDLPLEANGLFIDFPKKADRLLSSGTVEEFDAAVTVFNSDDPKEKFIRKACQIIRINGSESLYKYKLLWPLLDLIAESASLDVEVVLTPGETPLLAMQSENKAKEDSRCAFSVDDTLRVETLDNAKILTMEATGAYGFKDRSRCGYDYVKGAFSCLAMLRKLAHVYNAAGFDLFSKIRTYFLHTKGNTLQVAWSLISITSTVERKIKLWAVYTPEPEVNLMHLVKEAEIPGSFNEMEKVADLLDFLWETKLRVENAVSGVKRLKKEHARTLRRAHIFGDPLPDLRAQVNQTVVELVKKDTNGMQHCAPKSPAHRV
ncbi:hypothetical protein EC973_007631 [Apophysomyces ossiformis]|uniref:Uncharacterized protein n=1 Tax=Apophysomyces ossiformis TaxID=679940 RepID=A0A8H7BLX1_9FUNG|nr:hypothetical protein EC973_007631 [Apophysomyces ossiformis]